jgi:hypothetical protein
MKNSILIVALLFSLNFAAQSFSLQQDNISMNGQSTNTEFSEFTYLEALSTDVLTWNIIVDSLPSPWDYSFCFPSCYPTGVSNGSLNITSGQEYLLNCHIYPNNKSGEGIIQMEITNGDETTEIVTWHVVSGSVGFINDLINEKSEINHIYNLNGQAVKEFLPNQIYIVELKNGSFFKTFVNN